MAIIPAIIMALRAPLNFAGKISGFIYNFLYKTSLRFFRFLPGGFAHILHDCMVADTKMLLFFLPPDRLTAGILLFLLGGSLFIPSFWCRCFCPYGALLGLLSICSPLAVTRNHESCTQCGKCSGACPAGIAVQNRRRVSGPECTGCMECVNACPHRDCLSLRAGYAAARDTCLPGWSVAALTLFAVAALYLWAVTSGHWETSLPREMWRALHENIHALRH